MKRFSLIIFPVVFFYILHGYGYAQKPSKVGLETKNYLKNLKINSSEKNINIIGEFSKDLHVTDKKIIPHEKSLYMELPNLYINSSKRLFKVNDTLLSQIFIYQKPQPQQGLVFHLSLLKKIDGEKDVSVSISKNKLLLNIKRTSTEKKVLGKKDNEILPKETVADNIRNTEEIDETIIKNKADETKGSAVKEASVSKLDEVELVDNLEEFSKESEKKLIDLIVTSKADSEERLLDEIGLNKEKSVSPHKIEENPDIGLPILFEKGREKRDVKRSEYEKISTNPLERFHETKLPNISSTAIRVFIALSLILAVILIIGFLFKKYLLKNSGLLWNKKLVKVLSSSYIGNKKSISLVQVGNEVLVLGISPNNISMLTKLEDKDLREKITDKKNKESLFSKELSKYYRHFDREEKRNRIDNIAGNIREKVKGYKRL